MAKFSRPAAERAEDSTGLGLERNRDDDVSLSLRRSRSQLLPPLVRMGLTQPSGTDGRSGADAEKTARQYPHVSETSNHERRQRVAQLQGPVGQVHCPWIPQSAEFHQCHLFPLWGSQPRPITTKNPEEPLLAGVSSQDRVNRCGRTRSTPSEGRRMR